MGKKKIYGISSDQINHAAFIIPLGRNFLNRIITTKVQSINLGKSMKMNSGTIND